MTAELVAAVLLAACAVWACAVVARAVRADREHFRRLRAAEVSAFLDREANRPTQDQPTATKEKP